MSTRAGTLAHTLRSFQRHATLNLMPKAGGSVLATLLFTDIVGSTQIAEEMGNRRWQELLSRHHRLIRAELKRTGGRELDTAGDGFFASFDSPASAIRCAWGASEAVSVLGIAIRAGVHIGEAEVADGKLSGVNVHVAARVMALAEPGEVLLTQGVRELVRGAGIAIADRGVHQLKGIEGEQHLYAVTEVDGAPHPTLPDEAERRSRRNAIAPPTFAKRRRVRVVAGVAALAVVAAAGAFALTAGGSSRPRPGPLRITGNAAALVDPKTGKLAKVIPLQTTPVAIAAGAGAIWVAETGGTVARIDPSSGKVQTIGVGGSIADIVVGGDVAWAFDAREQIITPINGRSAAVGTPIRFATDHRYGPTSLDGVAFGDDALWLSGVTNYHNFVDRIDPATGKIDGIAAFDVASFKMAVGEGYAWAASESQVVKIALTAHRIPIVEPTTCDAECRVQISSLEYEISTYDASKLSSNGQPVAVAGSGSVWILEPTGELLAIDPSTANVAARSNTCPGATGFAVGVGRLWVTCQDGSVSALDQRTGHVVATSPVPGGLPTDVAVAADGTPWIIAESKAL